MDRPQVIPVRFQRIHVGSDQVITQGEGTVEISLCTTQCILKIPATGKVHAGQQELRGTLSGTSHLGLCSWQVGHCEVQIIDDLGVNILLRRFLDLQAATDGFLERHGDITPLLNSPEVAECTQEAGLGYPDILHGIGHTLNCRRAVGHGIAAVDVAVEQIPERLHFTRR